MLGVKVFGRAPMAWRIRPGYRGDLNIVRRRGELRESEAASRTNQVRTCKAVRRIACCVQRSLPCVSMRGRENRRVKLCGHSEAGYRSRKSCLQKRLRLWHILPWKTPRLSLWGRQGITVRTKWQSGTCVGNAQAGGSNGNGLRGNGRFRPEKVNPT